MPVSINVYVCIYIYIHIYTCIYIYICVHISFDLSLHLSSYVSLSPVVERRAGGRQDADYLPEPTCRYTITFPSRPFAECVSVFVYDFFAVSVLVKVQVLRRMIAHISSAALA